MLSRGSWKLCTPNSTSTWYHRALYGCFLCWLIRSNRKLWWNWRCFFADVVVAGGCYRSRITRSPSHGCHHVGQCFCRAGKFILDSLFDTATIIIGSPETKHTIRSWTCIHWPYIFHWAWACTDVSQEIEILTDMHTSIRTFSLSGRMQVHANSVSR